MASSAKFKINPAVVGNKCDMDNDITVVKLERLSHRVMILSFLLPLLIIALLVVTYFNVKQKQTSRRNELKSLSGDLESRFSSLSLKMAKIEATVTKAVKANTNKADLLEKKENGILEKLSMTQKNLDRLKKDDDHFSKKIAQLEVELTALSGPAHEAIASAETISKEIQLLDQSLDTLDDALTSSLQKLSDNLGEINDNVEQLQKDVSFMATNKISKKTMDAALADLKPQNQLGSIKDQMELRISSLRKRMAVFEGFMDRLNTFKQQTERRIANLEKNNAAIPNSETQTTTTTTLKEESLE